MASPGDQGQGLPPPTPGLLPGQVLWERSFCTIHSSPPCSSWQISSGLGTGHPVHGGRKKILDFCEPNTTSQPSLGTQAVAGRPGGRCFRAHRMPNPDLETKGKSPTAGIPRPQPVCSAGCVDGTDSLTSNAQNSNTLQVWPGDLENTTPSVNPSASQPLVRLVHVQVKADSGGEAWIARE